MPKRHQPRSADHRRTEVVAVAFFCLAGVESHSNPQLAACGPLARRQGGLGFDCCRHTVVDPGERRTESITRRGEHVATAGLDELSHHANV